MLRGTYLVTADDLEAGTIANTGSADSDQTDEVEAIVVTPLPFPAMSVTKTQPTNADEDDSADVSVGDTLTYSVVATNTGTATLTNVVVSDPMLTPPSRTCAILAPGATCVLTGTYVVTQADVDAGQVANTATGDSNQTAVITTPPVVTPVPEPAMTVAKSQPTNADEDHSGDVSVGDTLTYSVTATNTGTANLSGVVVTDELITPSSRTCALVRPGETCVLTGTYVVTQADVDAGVIDNVGSAGSEQIPAITSPVIVTPTPTPGLAIVKSPPVNLDNDASGTVSLGDRLSYTIVATNTGTATLTDVIVTDTRITPSTITCAVVPPGQTCVLTGTYVVGIGDVAAGAITNTATADSDQTGPVDDTVTIGVPVGELPGTGSSPYELLRLAFLLTLLGAALWRFGGRRPRTDPNR